MTDTENHDTDDTETTTETPPARSASTRYDGPAPLFLQTLICPISRGALTYDKAAGELISKAAGLAFPVRDGVPIMLEDEARELTEADLS